MTLDDLNRWIAPLKNRMFSLLRRAALSRVDDSMGVQQVQIQTLADVVHDGVERMQNYGMTSNPPVGSEGVVVYMNGNQDAGVVVVVDNRSFRLKSLAPGEVAIYTDEGDKIHFNRGNIINIVTGTLNITASTKVNITSPNVAITAPTVAITAASMVTMTTPVVAVTGNVLAGGGIASGGASASGSAISTPGNVIAGGDVSDNHSTMQAMRTVYNSHTHTENGVSGSPATNPPGSAM